MMRGVQKFHRGYQPFQRPRHGRWHQRLLIFGAILLVAVSIWMASEYHSFVNLGYQVIELRDSNQALSIEQERLKAELERQKRPDRVMREILAMGLQRMPPSNRFTIRIRGDESLEPTQPESQSGEEVLVAFSDSEP